MSKIAIISDTDASLPADLAAQYNIPLVPINVHFGEETFRSEYDITDTQVFERIDREGKLPTTSAPSPGEFAEAFQSAIDGGAESIICITVSSVVSATYAAAITAQEMMEEHDIEVLDSLSLSMGQGFMVLEAAQAAAEGATKDEVIAHAMDVRERVNLFAALSTLKYLAMSGRVGQLAAGMATLLNVKPILTIQEGKLDMLERVRTRSKSWKRVIELLDEGLKGKQAERMAIVHVAAEKEAREFEDLLRRTLSCPDEIILADLTAGLSVHSGAGMVGVGYLAPK